ncbi:MAG: ATP-dependent DNA ligase [Vulcanimicrobiaceae bacterium]
MYGEGAMVTSAYAAMEMRPVAQIPDGPGWLYEPKWDGFRCLAHRDGTDVALTSKAGQALARYFPEIVDALRALPFDRFSFDGELVVPRGGTLSFDALQQRIHPATSRVAALSIATPALYLVFDLLREAGADVVDRPLARRRELLERSAARFAPPGCFGLSRATRSRDVVAGWFADVGGALDGIVAKKLAAGYASGRRDAAVKVKRMRTADCVVAGFRYAAGRDDLVGSLLLGLYDEAGLLDYVGFCSAFARAERVRLREVLTAYSGGAGFTGNAPGVAPSRWTRDPQRDRSYVALEPQLVLEVGFDLVTAGRIRHGARPIRWRSDKAPHQCTVDQLDIAGAVGTLL